MIKAGRIFFKKLESNIRQENSFVDETTLSGTYINAVARRAKDPSGVQTGRIGQVSASSVTYQVSSDFRL